MATPLNVLHVKYLYLHVNIYFRLYKSLMYRSQVMAKVAGLLARAKDTAKVQNRQGPKSQIALILIILVKKFVLE